jgi:hypothetical protein
MRVPPLIGPYKLNKHSISMIVTRAMPGAYLLGENESASDFIPQYCSRADIDLASRLLDHVGLYKTFMFQYALSPRAAFDIECALFHIHRPCHNRHHPRPPVGSGCLCTVCDQERSVS